MASHGDPMKFFTFIAAYHQPYHRALPEPCELDFESAESMINLLRRVVYCYNIRFLPKSCEVKDKKVFALVYEEFSKIIV